MSDRIRRVLAERILSGRIAPGARLVEMRIAKEFATSQAPVREALRELEMMRMVESRPFRGTHVRAVCGRETDEAYQVRAVLEEAAAIPAAARLKGNLGAVREALDGLHEAARAGDREEYARYNLDFHRAIVAAAGNPTLLRAWESLGFEVKMRVTVARDGLDLVRVAAGHDAIAEALEAGDGPRAARLLREHAESFIRKADTPERNGHGPGIER